MPMLVFNHKDFTNLHRCWCAIIKTFQVLTIAPITAFDNIL